MLDVPNSARFHPLNLIKRNPEPHRRHPATVNCSYLPLDWTHLVLGRTVAFEHALRRAIAYNVQRHGGPVRSFLILNVTVPDVPSAHSVNRNRAHRLQPGEMVIDRL